MFIKLEKVINPDAKHTFTNYSLVFSKESNMSSKLVPVQELASPVNVRMPIGILIFIEMTGHTYLILGSM
jgi:hypothetical protein